jgi:predicted DNA-binding protein
VKKKIDQVKVSTYLSRDLLERLKALSERTRVPQAAYFREAIEELLKKYEESNKKRGGGK